MNGGKYYRIGKHDLWLACDSNLKATLRIEWLGEGVRIEQLSFNIQSMKISVNSSARQLIVESDKGPLLITEYPESKTSLVLQKPLFMSLKVMGKESGYKCQRLLTTLFDLKEAGQARAE